MSELIYSSEVQTPPNIDWTNPDTSGLLTCQFDDGTTVTNCLTGATGETFDIANIVGVAEGAYRVSATWTAKPALIDTNPFSLLQTQQDVQQEYELVIPLNRTNLEAITLDTGINSSKDFLLRVVLKADNQYGAGKPTILGTTGAYSFSVYASTTIRIVLNWTAYSFTLNTAWNNSLSSYHDIVIRLNAGTLTATQNGVALIETFTGVTAGLICPTDFCARDVTEYYIKLMQFVSYDFPTDSRYWSFNQTIGTTVTDLYNGKLATLTNFVANTEWLPIIPTDIFNIKSDGTLDYVDVTAFNTAQNSSLTNQKECKLLSNSVGGSISGFANGLTINGIDKSKSITTALTLTTTGFTQINNVITGDILASGATNDVVVYNSEVNNVTG